MRAAWTWLVVALLPAVVCADFAAATKDYQAGRLAAAFDGFRTEAELGHAESMFNLAVMYWNGQGVPRDRSQGYAWFALAADYEFPRAVEEHGKLAFGRIPPYEAAAKSLQDRFGRTGFAGVVQFDCRAPVETPPQIKRIEQPVYPMVARADGFVGMALVTFEIGRDGRARDVEVIDALPRDKFDAAIVTSVLHSEYAPATQGGEPVPQRVRNRFSFGLEGGAAGPRFEKWFANLTNKYGDRPAVRYLYAVHSIGLNERSPGQGRDLVQPSSGAPLHARFESDQRILGAAQAGLPEAEYYMARFPACDDPWRAFMWLRRAAAGGHPRAQAEVASLLLFQGQGEAQAAEAATWVRRASSTRDARALRVLAEALATSSPGDAALAQELLDRLPKWAWEDPTIHEIRAAAHALGADYPRAIAAEDEAIRLAAELGWDLATLRLRREAYASGKPWRQPIEY